MPSRILGRVQYLLRLNPGSLAVLPAPRTYISDLTAPPIPLPTYGSGMKRALDLSAAILLLLAVYPVLLVLGAIVALDGGKPFFGHQRVGKNGQIFKCWKIRSMCIDADARLKALLESDPEAAAEWARDHKLRNDPRITRLGRILRKTSLDELPQIWNVFKGEMSLVGPRPVTEAEIVRYGAGAAAYASQRPGLTGLWQVEGRNDVSYEERVALDVRYVNSISFWLDVRILLKTVVVMLRKTGC